MDFFECVKTRRMHRHFSPRPVPIELVMHALKVLRYSPRAGGVKGFKFIVLKGESKEKFLSLSCDTSFLSSEKGKRLQTAPIIVLVAASPLSYKRSYGMEKAGKSPLAETPVERWPLALWLVDASFAAMLFMLALNDLGLGAWLFYLRKGTEEVKESFCDFAQTTYEPLFAIAVGFPKREERKKRPLPGLSELVAMYE